MEKKELRESMIQKLNSTSPDEKMEVEQKITQTLLNSKLWKESETIGITISQHIEWNTKPIIKEAWSQGKSVCVPKCYPSERDMVFYKINSYTQVENSYNGLLEPISTITEEIKKKQIDLLIVPGLLFDQDGFRIGFGGGYYDRFLKDFPNETLSLLSRSQLVKKIPTDPYDIPVKSLIVEDKWMK